MLKYIYKLLDKRYGKNDDGQRNEKKEEEKTDEEKEIKNLDSSQQIVYLVRELLKGIQSGEYEYDKLKGDERIDFLAEADRLSKNKVLQAVIYEITRRQIDFSIKQAGNLAQVDFGRATINGASLVKEEFDILSVIYNDELINKNTKVLEDDKYKII